MPNNETITRWQKENTVMFSVRLQKKYDNDIIDFLEAKKNRNGTVKDALRTLMKAEGFPVNAKEENKTETKKEKETMKSIIIKGLELPTKEGSFIDVRIKANGTALVDCCMGECSTYEVEEIEIPKEE